VKLPGQNSIGTNRFKWSMLNWRQHQEVKMTNDYCIIFFGRAQASIGPDRNAREVTIEVKDTRTGNGEIAVLSNDLLSDSVVTLEKALFALISQGVFKNWLLNSPGMESSQL
jgi:hypothetical protein